MKYISVIDDTGRKSSLEISGDSIEVIGVLPHNSKIVPASIDDAIALRDWLTDYIKSNMIDHVEAIL